MFPSLAHHARAVSLGTGWQVRRCGLALNRSRPLAPVRGWEEPEWAGPVPGYGPSLQIPRVDGEYDLKMPRDMAYVFSGAYTPLSCKIIEQVSLAAAAEHLQAPAALWGYGRGPSAWGWGRSVTACPVPQVLERRGWLGLEEVVRLLNGNEFSVSGSSCAGRVVGLGRGLGVPLARCAPSRQRCGGQPGLGVAARRPRRLPGRLHLLRDGSSAVPGQGER